MRKLAVVVALVLAAAPAAEARVGVDEGEDAVPEEAAQKEQAPLEKNAKPEGNEVAQADVKDLRKMLTEFEEALYLAEQEKIAAKLAEAVKPHAEELLGRLKLEKGPTLDTIRLLGFSGSAEAVEALRKLTDSADARVRSAAAFSLGVARDAGAVDKLVKLLDDKDAKVASQAAIALGRIGVKRSYEALEKRLKSKDLLKRLAAIRAIGLLRDERAVDRLEEQLRESEDPLEMTAVLDALNLIAGDNLFRIIAQLERVAAALEKHGTGRQTQLAQAAITDALDRFIKEQERRGQGQGQGQGQGRRRRTSSGQQPGQASGSASGPQGQGGSSPRTSSEAGDVAATDSSFADLTRTAGVVWGNLPPAVQEEITAALKQELPERYKHLLKIYYRILAEGK